jgi:hypothetical protein
MTITAAIPKFRIALATLAAAFVVGLAALAFGGVASAKPISPATVSSGVHTAFIDHCADLLISMEVNMANAETSKTPAGTNGYMAAAQDDWQTAHDDGCSWAA